MASHDAVGLKDRRKTASPQPRSEFGPMTAEHRKMHNRSSGEIPEEAAAPRLLPGERTEFQSLPASFPTDPLPQDSTLPPSPAPVGARECGVGAPRTPEPSASRNLSKPELQSASLEVQSNGSGGDKGEAEADEEKEKEDKGKEIQRVEEEETRGAVGGSIEVHELALSLDSKPGGDSSAEESEKELEKKEKAAQTEEFSIKHFIEAKNPDFPIDQPVFVLINRQSRVISGKIRWTGGHFAIHDSKLAVVELDEKYEGASNGLFLGQSLCHTKRNRALMVEVKQLHLHRTPFYYGQHCRHQFDSPERQGTIWHLRGSTATVEWESSEPSQTSEQALHSVPISELRVLPSSCGKPCRFPLQPIGPSRLHRLIGKHRGIQGDSNSCYLDTTLFCLFGFSTFWEQLMQNSDSKARDTLLHQVVYPLRADCFVPSHNVRAVRSMLCLATGHREFESQSRDLPETLEALLGKALNVQPMVMTSSLGRDAVSFPASFSIETMPPLKQPKFCTSQHFLESSAIMMDFQLTAVPKCLILLLPRQRGYFMKEVIPALELDLEPVLEGGSKLCYVCGEVADTQCPQAMENCSAASTFYCSNCLELENVVNRICSDGASLRQIPLKPAGKRIENCRLQLSAVICISHSHYNCFARCGREWIFFDSMSDREVFGGNQICVPRIRSVGLNTWIRQKLTGSSGINAAQSDRDICDRAFSCPYALIYNAPEC